MTLVRIGLVLAVAVAAAVVANVVLLNIASGSHEPVGHLRLATVVQSTPTPTASVPTPATPASHEHPGEAGDD